MTEDTPSDYPACRLYTWIPTGISAPPFDPTSAASVDQSNIGSLLNVAASTMVAAGPAQGGPSQVCHGPCISGSGKEGVLLWVLVAAVIGGVAVGL